MKVTIQSLDFDITKKLNAFVNRALRKIGRLYPPILEAQVFLKTDGDALAVYSKVCEIKLVIPGKDLFASKKGETFEMAVQNTIDALKHQVERLRTDWDKQRVTPV
jgi:ribosomal subunit interface protein